MGLRGLSCSVFLAPVGCQRDPKTFPGPLQERSGRAFLALMELRGGDTEHRELWGQSMSQQAVITILSNQKKSTIRCHSLCHSFWHSNMGSREEKSQRLSRRRHVERPGRPKEHMKVLLILHGILLSQPEVNTLSNSTENSTLKNSYLLFRLFQFY